MNNYDQLPAVRRSELWEMRKSPAHYIYAATHEKAPTPALIFGTAAHKYILETDAFFNDYILLPKLDRRTREGKAKWEEITSSGKTPISEEDYNTILDMDKAIRENPTAAQLLKTGEHEIPIAWTDWETNEACKCRPDCITTYEGDKYIVDYKTTTSCEGGAFERSCRAYGYKLQAGMYTEGVMADRFEQHKFAFVAQEKTPPYAVRVYFCDPGFVEEGAELFRDLIRIYHKCSEAGEWPGYRDEVLYGD